MLKTRRSWRTLYNHRLDEKNLSHFWDQSDCRIYSIPSTRALRNFIHVTEHSLISPIMAFLSAHLATISSMTWEYDFPLTDCPLTDTTWSPLVKKETPLYSMFKENNHSSAGNNSQSWDIVQPNLKISSWFCIMTEHALHCIMTEHLTSTSWVTIFKVLSVNKLCQVQFVKYPTKEKIWKDICSVNKEKLFPALHRNLYTSLGNYNFLLYYIWRSKRKLEEKNTTDILLSCQYVHTTLLKQKNK